MEKKLEKLLKNKVSPKFVVGLEQKLMEQYKPARRPFFFWRYSFAGASFMILLVAAVVVSGPFSSKNNIVANALEQYQSLEQQKGVFHSKERITITGYEGVESELGNDYISETWIGDNGESLFKGSGKRDMAYLDTADGRSFTDNSVTEGLSMEKRIYCVLDKRRIEKDNIVGRVFFNVKADDYSKYEVSSGLVGEEEGWNEPGEAEPLDQWREDGRMPVNVLQELKDNDDYEVEDGFLDGREVYQITSEANGEVAVMYFDKADLVLKRAVYTSEENVSSKIKITIDYLVVENIANTEAEKFFVPTSGMKEYYPGPGFIDEVSCYESFDDKLSDEEVQKLLKEIPESAKKEIEKYRAIMNRELDMYPERDWEIHQAM